MNVTEKELSTLFTSSVTREKAFRIIVDEYKERLYWHIRKIVIQHEDADDILQNTFIKAWENADSFREESTLYTWLYRIATNESLSFLRKEKKSWDKNGTNLLESLESDAYFNGDAVQKKLQQAILSLPERQRLVFNMKYFDEMKYENMAEILELSVGALKASYHHAVKKIMKIFQAD
ncbi:MAG: RNA polymerase sigma factor [Bacteroidales bacterium]|nr:RNA polymerase sigma factor [Bacteroidales bacterium]